MDAAQLTFRLTGAYLQNLLLQRIDELEREASGARVKQVEAAEKLASANGLSDDAREMFKATAASVLSSAASGAQERIVKAKRLWETFEAADRGTVYAVTLDDLSMMDLI